MKKIFIILFFHLFIMDNAYPRIIYDFNKKINIRDWIVVDDGVMGGLSLGKIDIDNSGNGIYKGYVSLENYGGFSSIRLSKKVKNIKEFQYIILSVHGDNKYYQFRIRSDYYDRHVYVHKFYAKDEWQEIKIPLYNMEPQFRGRKLRMRNFNSDSIVEFGILIGNKVNEEFSLLIDYIAFE